MNKHTLYFILFVFQVSSFSENSCKGTLFHLEKKKNYKEDLQKLNEDIDNINRQIFKTGILKLEKDCFFKNIKKGIKLKRKLYKQFYNENNIGQTLESVNTNLINECLLFGKYSKTLVNNDHARLSFKFNTYALFDSYISEYYNSLDDFLYSKITSKDSEHLDALYRYEDIKLDIQIKITKYWLAIDRERYFKNVYYYMMNRDIYFTALDILLPKLIKTRKHLKTLFDPNDPLMIKIDKEIEYICGSKECPMNNIQKM